MSAFVVSPRTMDRVVRALVNPWCDGSLHSIGHHLAATPLPQGARLGRLLYAMNMDAVRQRYPDCVDRPENMPGVADAYLLKDVYAYRGGSHAFLKPDTMIDSYKAIQCLSYQCSEGNVPECLLYQQLDAIPTEMASVLGQRENEIRESRAYKDARWDA